MSCNKQLMKSEFGTEVAEFLNIAYRDYLAARILLNSHLPAQGAVLASTAIEKYFKAILAFNGNESRGHLKKAHLNAIRNYDSKLWSVLNEEFLELLQKAYAMRYLDDLYQNFNLVIASREFLAELDHTVITIQEKFNLKQGNKVRLSIYQNHLTKNDSNLFLNNHILNRIDKHEFIIAEPQFIYEVRNCPLHGLLEAYYSTDQPLNDGKFMRGGIFPKYG